MVCPEVFCRDTFQLNPCPAGGATLQRLCVLSHHSSRDSEQHAHPQCGPSGQVPIGIAGVKYRKTGRNQKSNESYVIIS